MFHHFCFEKKSLICVGFDIFFVLPGLEQVSKGNENKRIHLIANNAQKIRTVSFGHYILLDSLSHLPNSLAKLSSDLKNSNHAWSILKQSSLVCDNNGQTIEKRVEMLQAKAHYPYRFATSLRKLRRTKTLPPISQFENILNPDHHLSQEEYEHAKSVFEEFSCENMEDYTALYCLGDCYLLAEVFFTYSQQMFDLFGVRPDTYLTIASFCMEAAFKTCDLEIPYLTDRNIYRDMESAVRGGMAFVNSKFAREKLSVSSDEKNTYIFVIDANS